MWKQLCHFHAKLYSKTFYYILIAYSFCFSFGGNLDFPDFLQRKFYNINYSSSGYGRRLMVERLWVRISTMDTKWIIFHIICWKIVLLLFEKTEEIKRVRMGMTHLWKAKITTFPRNRNLIKPLKKRLKSLNLNQN